MTEAELKDEVMARIGAEKQLQAAEKALEHLETALKLTGAQMSELQEHIMPDVHKLRGEFFEQCAEEAKMDANRSIIMRNAIHARRSLRRSKTRIRGSFRRKFVPTIALQPAIMSSTGSVAGDHIANDEEASPKIESSTLMHL
ncbi:unnamed protein product [Gongylonema pulchrum]|uniref:Nbl1_Borealin_N domain-containing protein n=1 Tax=Gongylonema pulchrum TaxID=637853 RepID=A0A183EXV5_9BILA|nr:unnamed protein product [Gongylonema pulchrum]